MLGKYKGNDRMAKNEIITKASEVTMLIDRLVADALNIFAYKMENRDMSEAERRFDVTRAKLQAIADEFAALKYCYSPDKVCRIMGKIE